MCLVHFSTEALKWGFWANLFLLWPLSLQWSVLRRKIVVFWCLASWGRVSLFGLYLSVLLQNLVYFLLWMFWILFTIDVGCSFLLPPFASWSAFSLLTASACTGILKDDKSWLVQGADVLSGLLQCLVRFIRYEGLFKWQVKWSHNGIH